MHELSLATSLMEPLLRIAAEQRAVRVAEVEVVCGAAQLVEFEAFRAAFEAVTTGTVAAGARLTLRAEPLRVRCRQCKLEFEARIDDYVCPACQRADVELIAGRDLILHSVVCEVE